MFFFTGSSLIITLSGTASFSLHVSSAVMGTGCYISFPLLIVMIAFTSSIPELLDDPLMESFWIWQCLGSEPSSLLYLQEIVNLCD